jgi:hypothetical protein
MIGEPLHAAAVSIHDVDLRVPVLRGREGDSRAIRGPGAGEHHLLGLVENPRRGTAVGEPEQRKLSSPRIGNVEDGVAFRRPARRELEKPGADLSLARPVVVHAADGLSRLGASAARVGDLGLGDSQDAGLGEDVVRDSMRELPDLVRGRAIPGGESLLRGREVSKPHLRHEGIRLVRELTRDQDVGPL